MNSPVAAQIAEIEARLPAERDAEKFARLRSAATTLRFIESHAAGLRTLVSYLRRVGQEAGAVSWEDLMPTPAEAAAILEAPGVRDVLREFPGARIIGVTEPAPAAADVPEEETA